MLQWIYYIIIFSIISGMSIIHNFASGSYFNETVKAVFTPATVPTNLKVEASPYKLSKHLQLNISWETDKGSQQPTSFNIHTFPLNESDPNCNTEPYYAYVENPNSTMWVVPPKTMAEANHHVSSFSLQPGCFYRIRLEANPHDGKTFIQTDYHVPECVEDICSCWHAEYLPKPELHVQNLTENTVNITWALAETQNITKFILRAGPKLLHGDHAAVYNLSWHVEQSTMPKVQRYHQTYVTHKRGKYAATVRVIDSHYCYGPEQQVVFTVGGGESTIYEEALYKNKLFWVALLPCGGILLVVCKLYRQVFHDNPACSQHSKQTASKLNQRVFYKSFRIKSDRVFRRNDSLQERNVLYVEKEIEEAKARGEVDCFEMSYNQLTFLREIGRGAFGQVLLARGEAIRGVPGSRMVAVKKLKVKASREEREEFLEEINMLKKVGRHPHVVSLLGCCTLDTDVCMVMEYVPCGDLLNYLRGLRRRLDARKTSVTSSDTMYSSPSTIMTSLNSSTYTTYGPSRDCCQQQPAIDHKELQNFALQIAKGMAHLESKQITHRDLAARNILIDNNKVLKISDFGLSRKGVYVNTRRRKVPLRWLALEAIRDSLYSSKSDVWAFAIVLWEIGTLGGFPYPTVSDFDLLRFLERGNRLEKPDIVSPNLFSVMLVCWSENPDHRPSFADLVSYLQPDPDRHIYVEVSSNPQLPPTSPDSYVNMAASPRQSR